MSGLAQFFWPEGYWEHHWIVLQVGCDRMTRLNMRWLYYLGGHLRALQGIVREGSYTGDPGFGMEMIWAREDLLRLVRSDDVNLPLCVPRAEGIIRQIDVFYPRLPESPQPGQSTKMDVENKILTLGDANLLKEDLQKFETVFLASLEAANVYSLAAMGNLSIDALISGAVTGYSNRVSSHLPAITREDINEAGRCLAFERATACGFHILRGVESVMEHYIIKAQGTIPAIKTWHEYIVAIDGCGGSDKIRNLLRSMKDHYRNPLMHPEDTLDIGQAIGLFSLSQTAIEAMITELIARNLIQP